MTAHRHPPPARLRRSRSRLRLPRTPVAATPSTQRLHASPTGLLAHRRDLVRRAPNPPSPSRSPHTRADLVAAAAVAVRACRLPPACPSRCCCRGRCCRLADAAIHPAFGRCCPPASRGACRHRAGFPFFLLLHHPRLPIFRFSTTANLPHNPHPPASSRCYPPLWPARSWLPISVPSLRQPPPVVLARPRRQRRRRQSVAVVPVSRQHWAPSPPHPPPPQDGGRPVRRRRLRHRV